MNARSSDETGLRLAFAVAAKAHAHGNHPFGCVLVDATGKVLLEAENGYMPDRDMTAHAERLLATAASRKYRPSELAACTMFTSAEPCAMCAGAAYWAGIGRVVYGLSEARLKTITGSHKENPTLELPCRRVFSAGQRKVEVVGPLLEDEAAEQHKGVWDYAMAGHDQDHDHGHHHDHDHSELSETELRVRALETVLTEKGYVDPAALDLLIETYEKKVGPRNGARVVAKAWSDPAYRARLLADATPAIAELGFAGRQGEHIVALENTPARHNMVVCTLCSCYPWPVLGLPPVWYKSAPYRSRAVSDPRGVLVDLGVTLAKDVEIRVWDSTAEIRYLVIPMRPKGSAGWSEDKLADLVTRDSMIGTGMPKEPA